MVDKKGIGYAIELIIAILIIFTFIVGSMQLQPGKTYTDYRISATANDLTYMTQKIGMTDQIAVRGQTGTLQTFIQSITDRTLKISGSIRGMPFQDKIEIGFHTDQEYSNGFSPVTSSDSCYGNLDQIQVYHESGDIYKNDDSTKHDLYNSTLYLANTSNTENYDAVFVDKGRNCDFTDGGPHYIDEIFMWGTAKSPGPIHFYEFKKGANPSSSNPVFYNATQVRRFQESFNKEVNNLDVQTEINLFRQSDPYNHYDLKIFRQGFGYNANNYEDSLSNSSALFLHNVSGAGESILGPLDEGDDFQSSVGSTSGSQSVVFPDYWAARNLRDYFMAMGNEGYLRYPAGGDVKAYQDDSRALAKNSAGDLTIVNHWTQTDESGLEIDRLARTGYLEYPKYTEEQVDFLVALSYWLTEEEEQFNHEVHNRDLIPTSSTGVAGSKKEVPYQLNLRWSR